MSDRHPESAGLQSAVLIVQVFDDVEQAVERGNASNGSTEEGHAQVCDYVGTHPQGAGLTAA